MSPLIQAIAAATAAGFASMIVAFFFTTRLNQTWLTRMVSFAAGLMLAIALLDLLPEALEGGMAAHDLFTLLLIALLALFALESKLHGGCATSCTDDLARPVPMVLVGGALHIFTDGLVLGATFLVDPLLAWGIALAVLLHEIPREAGDFALLLSARWSHRKALLWNAISRSGCIVGAILGYLTLSNEPHWLPYILAIAAANFIYLALSGILPWLRHGNGSFAWQGSMMIAGAALVPLSLELLR